MCDVFSPFPGGFQFQGNFLKASSFSTFQLQFLLEKRKGTKRLESKDKWYLPPPFPLPHLYPHPPVQGPVGLLSYNRIVCHERILRDCITIYFRMMYVLLGYLVRCCKQYNVLFPGKTLQLRLKESKPTDPFRECCGFLKRTCILAWNFKTKVPLSTKKKSKILEILSSKQPEL